MTQEQINTLATEMNLSEGEIKSIIRQLGYRKEYNQRPEVKAARRAYNQKRQARIKLALKMMKDMENQSINPLTAIQLLVDGKENQQ